jgi:hypothetical protein
MYRVVTMKYYARRSCGKAKTEKSVIAPFCSFSSRSQTSRQPALSPHAKTRAVLKMKKRPRLCLCVRKLYVFICCLAGTGNVCMQIKGPNCANFQLSRNVLCSLASDKLVKISNFHCKSRVRRWN